MQDRVSLYPGRVKLVPVAGQENTYDMTRADSPTQEGMPLNKENLLKDATAALYGLDETAVPDDVFVKIFERIALYREIQRYETAGAFVFTVPENISHILAFIISGGNSGTAVSYNISSSENYDGGSSGNIGIFVSDNVSEGDTFNVVVGKGGDAVKVTYGNLKSGNQGGASSFGSVAVLGGGGIDGNIYKYGATSQSIQTNELIHTAFTVIQIMDIALLNAFYPGAKALTNLAPGGGASVNSSGISNKQNQVTFPNGKKSSGASTSTSGSVTATKGTDFGCGGGVAIYKGSGKYTATSAPGMNGVVAVWGY